MVEAAGTITTDKSVKLFERFGIFTRAELESREEILYENYAKTINIEALTMIEMSSKQIIPAVVKYTKELADTVNSVKSAGADASVYESLLKDICAKLARMQKALEDLKEVENTATSMKEGKEQAYFYREKVMAAMEALRIPADELEMVVDKKVWPFPTYGDLLFEV